MSAFSLRQGSPHRNPNSAPPAFEPPLTIPNFTNVPFISAATTGSGRPPGRLVKSYFFADSAPEHTHRPVPQQSDNEESAERPRPYGVHHSSLLCMAGKPHGKNALRAFRPLRSLCHPSVLCVNSFLALFTGAPFVLVFRANQLPRPARGSRMGLFPRFGQLKCVEGPVSVAVQMMLTVPTRIKTFVHGAVRSFQNFVSSRRPVEEMKVSNFLGLVEVSNVRRQRKSRDEIRK